MFAYGLARDGGGVALALDHEAIRPHPHAQVDAASQTFIRKHIAPSPVAGLRVGEIRRRDLQAFADDLLATGLSPATVSNAMNPIQAFYRRAIHSDELAYNPSALIDLPEASSKRPKRIASAAEAAELLAVLPVEDRPVWATAFYAGLRRGELQALRVCDIDFGTNLVSVERGWDQVEGVIEPKSRAGRRTVPLLAVLRSYLWDFLPQTGRSGGDLLFGRTDDEAFFASTVDGRAKRAWKARNKRECELAETEDRERFLLRPITLHECRHTFASLLIDSGANPKAIQQFMGHSKIQTTFDVYGHLLPGSHDEVRKRMGCLSAWRRRMMSRSDGAAILVGMPLISRIRSGRVRRLEEQMRAMDSKIDAMAETFESRRADDEAAAIAAERIRSGAADQMEDGAQALASLGINLPKE